LLAAEFAHHGAPALRRLPGPSHRHHVARPGNPEPQEAAQRDLREAQRPDLQGDRRCAGTRPVPYRGDGPRVWYRRQGDRQTLGRTGREDPVTTRSASVALALTSVVSRDFSR